MYLFSLFIVVCYLDVLYLYVQCLGRSISMNFDSSFQVDHYISYCMSLYEKYIFYKF